MCATNRRPRNPPPTWPSRQRPPATLCHPSLVRTAYAFYSYRHQPPMKAARKVGHRRQPVRCGGPATLPPHGRRAATASDPSSFPHPPTVIPAKGDLCTTTSFPHPPPPSFPRKRESMVARAGGPPPNNNQNGTAPRSYRRVPQSNQSSFLHFPASVSAKKRLDHHTKLNIQTRSGRPSRGLTRWPGGAYRASWPGGRPTHRPGGD